MIAIYDIDNSLRPFLSKRLSGSDQTVYEIKSMKELVDIVSNKLSQFDKIYVNTKGLTTDEVKNTFAPLLKTPVEQAKVMLYDYSGKLPCIMNNKIFIREPIGKKTEETSSQSSGFKKTGLGSKYEHILIGISTGGPPTLEAVLPQFPADLPVSIVVIQHMLRGNHIYHLCDRLNKISQIEVKVAEEGDILRKGVAYFPPPGFHLYYKRMPNGQVSIHLNPEYLKRGQSKLFDTNKKFVHVPSVDIGLESATEVFGDKLVAAILTGMGSDGAISLKYARDNGAYTMSQEESSCIIYGMPKAAYEHGGSMEVLKHYFIPNRMMEIIKY